MLLPQPSVIPFVNLPDVDTAVRRPQWPFLPFAEGANFLRIQHLILNIRDHRAHISQVRLRRPFLLHLLVYLGQNTGRPLLIRHQLKRLFSQDPAVISDNLCTNTVYCPKLQPRSQVFAKIARKPAGHVTSCCDCICHRQNILRIDAALCDHITEPQNQYCGLAASRYCQKKNRAIHCFDRFRLLWVQYDPLHGISLYTVFLFHKIISPQRSIFHNFTTA